MRVRGAARRLSMSEPNSFWPLALVAIRFHGAVLDDNRIIRILSYQISVTIALLLVSLDDFIHLRRSLKTCVRILFATFILFFHPFGLIFYELLLIARIIGYNWNVLYDRRRSIKIVLGSISTIPIIAIPLACLLLLSPTPPGVHDLRVPGLFTWEPFTPYHLILTVASPFLTYNMAVDALFVSPLVVLLLYSICTSRVEIHAGMIIMGLVVTVLSLITPIRAGDEYWVNRRFPLMAVLLLSAGVLPKPLEKRSTSIAVTAGVLSIVVARTVWIDQVWQSRQRDVQSIESAISHVPRGAAVFSVQSEPVDPSKEPVGRYLGGIPKTRWETVMRHMPALVVPQRLAFTPTLFSVPGQQPLKILPPWTDLTPVLSAVPDMHVLDRSLTPEVLQRDPYLGDWKKWFDYVIIIGTDHEDYLGPFVPPDQLRLVSDNGYANLYQVVK